MSSPTPVRFPEDIDSKVAARASAYHLKKSQVIVMAQREWLLMQDHPLIVFTMTNTGERRARLIAGPQVWTVAEAWLQHEPKDRKPDVVGEAVGLSTSDVEAALNYWADCREEIDRILEAHKAAQDAELKRWQGRQDLNAVEA